MLCVAGYGDGRGGIIPLYFVPILRKRNRGWPRCDRCSMSIISSIFNRLFCRHTWKYFVRVHYALNGKQSLPLFPSYHRECTKCGNFQAYWNDLTGWCVRNRFDWESGPRELAKKIPLELMPWEEYCKLREEYLSKRGQP